MDKLRTGVRTPFFCTDITFYLDLLSGSFSPIEDIPVVFTETEEEVYIKSGFLASNAGDYAGFIYVVTWNEYQIHRTQNNRALVTNAQVLALCNAMAVFLESGKWTATPLVKVFGLEIPVYMPHKLMIGQDPFPFPDPPTESYIEFINIGTIR